MNLNEHADIHASVCVLGDCFGGGFPPVNISQCSCLRFEPL